MLVSERQELVERARHLATQAREPAPHYEHTRVGYNYRLSNLLAAVGRGQLRLLGDRVAVRRAHNEFYRRRLGAVPGIGFMPQADYGVPTCWLTCITVDDEAFGASREQIRLHLETRDVESRPVWKPMHLQPVFRDCRTRGGEVAADLFARGLCLPSGSGLTPAQRDLVAETLLSTPRRIVAS